MTYLPTEEGWLYLAVVLDLYARAYCRIGHAPANDGAGTSGCLGRWPCGEAVA
jgi:hypothetical protein